MNITTPVKKPAALPALPTLALLVALAVTPLVLSAPGSTQSLSELTKNLQEDLDRFRERTGVPAVGAALFSTKRTLAIAVSGHRTNKGEVPVTKDDLWHIGSVSKSFTSTLIATLVEQQTRLGDDPESPTLSWETPLGSLIEEAKETPYAAVTLRQLLGHRAGLSANADLLMMQIRRSKLPITEQRTLIAQSMLSKAPLSTPGTSMLYSNNGYLLAGVIAERLLGASWEEIVEQQVMVPLGLTTFGFGAPGEPGTVDQPQGHVGKSNKKLTAVKGPLADNPAFMGPAATLHMSLSDLATYARTHLAGEVASALDATKSAATKALNGPLTAASFRELHSSQTGQTYAMGWDNTNLPTQGGSERLIWHNGSNTMWYTFVGLFPEAEAGVVVTINAGLHNATAVDRLAIELHRKYSVNYPANETDPSADEHSPDLD